MKLKRNACIAAAACLLSAAAAWSGPVSAADGGVILMAPAGKIVSLEGTGTGNADAETGTGSEAGTKKDYGAALEDSVFDRLAESGVTGFLQKEKLPKNIVYVSLLPNKKDIPIGQLQVKDKDFVKTAEVIHATLPSITSGQLKYIFQEDPAKVKDILEQVNQWLFMAQPAINGWIQDALLAQQKKTGEKWPEDIVSVELRDIQGLQPLKGTGQPVYVVGGRIIPKADGWVIPLYVKAYLFLQDGAGRAMMVITTDEERDAIEKAADRIVRELNKK